MSDSNENNEQQLNDASNQNEIKEEDDENLEKVQNENKNTIIPENPIQNVHNLNNEELENRNISDQNQPIYQTQKMIIQDSKYQPNNNNKIEGIMSTGIFMKNIDIRCDDHLKNYNTDVQATRFCSQCKSLCCDTCVIDFHNEHINFAKTKIEEYFRNAKLKLEDLSSKVNNSIRFRVNYEEIDKIIQNHQKILDSYFNRRKNKLEDIKKKIDMIIEYDNEIHNTLNDNIETFYKDECAVRMNQPLEENKSLLKKIQNFLSEWNNLSKTEKVQTIKSNQIEEFEKENEENSEMIKNATEAFKGKSKDIEKKINEILKDLNGSDRLNDFDKIIDEVQKNIIDSREKINKLKYDDLIIQKVENIVKQRNIINPLPVNNNQQIQNNSNKVINNNDNFPQHPISELLDNHSNKLSNNNFPNYQNNPQMGYSSNNNNNNMGFQNNPQMGYSSNNNNNNMGLQNNPQMGYSSNKNNNNLGYSNNNNNEFQLMGQSDYPQSTKIKDEEYEFFMFLKLKSNVLLIYDPISGFKIIKVSKNNFQNPSESFINFPDNSKYVNLGSSVLLTGGYINRQLTNSCFLMIVGKIKDSNDYELSIMPYGRMMEARERHNIIYLPDKKTVLVCSGFFNKGSEYSEINMSEWKSAGEMNEVRGNATISYINNRYVYVIGGYKILEDKNGYYHGDCEYLDFNNLNYGWRQINFANMSIQLSAMGVIPVSNNHFLLCGGYDGQQYKREVYKVDCSNPNNVSIDKMNILLPGSYIFLHNTFIKIGEYYYNIELNGSAINFSLDRFDFGCIKANV